MQDRAVVEQGINWVMAFVAGAVAIGFGIYLLFDESNATALIVGIISFALLLGSLIHLLQGLRRHANEFAARAALLSGGVGVTVGAIVTLDLFYDYLDDQAARVILASGLIVYGVLGLAGMLVQRVEGTVVRTIVTCAFALGFAALLLFYSQDDQLNTTWFAIALIVTGLLLLGLGYFARNHQSRLLERRDTGTGTGATGKRPSAGDATPTVGERKPEDATAQRSTRPAAPVAARAATTPPGRAAQSRSGHGSDSAVTSDEAAPVIAQPGQETRNRLLERDVPQPTGPDGPTRRS